MLDAEKLQGQAGRAVLQGHGRAPRDPGTPRGGVICYRVRVRVDYGAYPRLGHGESTGFLSSPKLLHAAHRAASMQQAAADHEEVMALSLEERVAQRVQDVKSMTKRPYAPAAAYMFACG